MREGLHRWSLPHPLALAIPQCVALFTNRYLLTRLAQAKTMQRLAPEVIASLAQPELTRGGGGGGGEGGGRGRMLPAKRQRVDEGDREAALLLARGQDAPEAARRRVDEREREAGARAAARQQVEWAAARQHNDGMQRNTVLENAQVAARLQRERTSARMQVELEAVQQQGQVQARRPAAPAAASPAAAAAAVSLRVPPPLRPVLPRFHNGIIFAYSEPLLLECLRSELLGMPMAGPAK